VHSARLPEDFSLSYDGEVRELSDDHLEVPHVRASQTRCDVSYVPVRVTPYALKAITCRSRDASRANALSFFKQFLKPGVRLQAFFVSRDCEP
jgi:hypothetical protein